MTSAAHPTTEAHLSAKYGITEPFDYGAEIARNKARDRRALVEHEKQRRVEALKAAKTFVDVMLGKIVEAELAPRLAESGGFKVLDVARAIENWRLSNEREFQLLRLQRLGEAADRVRNRGSIEVNYRTIALQADVVAEAEDNLRVEIHAAAEGARPI